MINKLIHSIHNWLNNIGLDDNISNIILSLIIILSIVLISILANWITKEIILNLIKQIIKRTKNNWDDILLEKRVFHRFSHIAPALVFYYSAKAFLTSSTIWFHLIQSGIHIYMLIVVMMIISSFLVL